MSFTFEPRDHDDNATEERSPTIRFTEEAWRNLVLYMLRCPFEIGGLGRLHVDGSDFLVSQVILVEQDVNDIATRLDSAALSRLLVEDLAANRDPAELKFWWHSHAHEAPFWSGVDEETIENFGADFLVSLVSNHELRFLARRDDYEPRRTTWVNVVVPDAAVDADSLITAFIDEEISDRTRHVPRANTSRLF